MQMRFSANSEMRPAMAGNKYGFYANVNPTVDHPRRSQANERVIGGGFFAGRQATLMFNGYEKEVAGFYRGLDLKRNFWGRWRRITRRRRGKFSAGRCSGSSCRWRSWKFREFGKQER